MTNRSLWFGWVLLFLLLIFSNPGFAKPQSNCRLNLFVLGNAQDAGKPQIAHHTDPAWQNNGLSRLPSSIAIVDKTSGGRYLFDATPDIKRQLYNLDLLSGKTGFALDGIFITHAHIGHYLGLAQLGREAMGAKTIPVYTMPKMTRFLEQNAPWSQLVKLDNIALNLLRAGFAVSLANQLRVTPFLVPHRDEFAETVGFQIQGPGKSVLYLPDIDAWEQWNVMGTHLEDLIAANDLLFLDGTFFSGNELPGRDMSTIPHPTITHTMNRLKNLRPADKMKIRFIHLNHSNPAHDKKSAAYKMIRTAGFLVAQESEHHCLD